MSKKNITISILIPVYNVEQYLEKCLDSILSQIDRRANIIVMNDASTDSSLEIAKRYESNNQIQVIDAPYNRGLSGTRNAMMELATSDYIWFIDSDDLMYEDVYQTVMDRLENLNIDVLCADYVSLRGDKEVRKKAFVGAANKVFFNKNNNSFIDNIIKNNSNHVWNKIFRKKLIDDIKFKEGINFEDIYYMTDISDKEFTYSYLKKAIIKYRERDGSIVKTLNKKYIDDYLGAFIYRMKHYKVLENGASGYNYLLYKSFKRYVGLINNITDLDQLDLLEYTYNKYNSYFLNIFDEVYKCLSIRQKVILKIKSKSLSKNHKLLKSRL